MPTKAAVVEMAKKLDTQHVEGAARDGILCRVSGFDFYNTSNYDFAKLISEVNSSSKRILLHRRSALLSEYINAGW